jgi:hypothetical protein
MAAVVFKARSSHAGLLYLLIDRRSDELIDMQHGQSINDRKESDRDSEDSVTTSETTGRTNICTPIEQLSLRLMSDDNSFYEHSTQTHIFINFI